MIFFTQSKPEFQSSLRAPQFLCRSVADRYPLLRSLPAVNSKKSLIGLTQENDCKVTGQLF